MSRLESFEGLAALPALPDYAVLTKAQTCAVTNLSADTLDRLHRQKKGPPRVQLSERRVGYPAGGLYCARPLAPYFDTLSERFELRNHSRRDKPLDLEIRVTTTLF